MNYSQTLIREIHNLAKKIDRDVTLMEVCGTHTQAVSRFGIKNILPQNVKLVAGPGCPVCVTAQEDIDAVVSLALAGIPIATYGDAIRVPGSFGSLENARQRQSYGEAKPAKVFSVYSVTEAMKLAETNPGLVFLGLGFETTAPMTAWAIKQAHKGCVVPGANSQGTTHPEPQAMREPAGASQGSRIAEPAPEGRRAPCEISPGVRRPNLDFSVYSTHKLFIPAMKALLDMGEIKIDGFIDPGHVSTIIGLEQYKILKGVPQVITGFEERDILEGIYMLLKQIAEGRADIENQYTRFVNPQGNPEAYKLIFDVFEPGDGNWRGFGIIPGSGLNIKKEFENFDAKIKYKNILDKVDFSKSRKPTACACGEIIRGLKSPTQCPMFKKVCTPENPYGPCMVSVEGVCNVEFRS